MNSKTIRRLRSLKSLSPAQPEIGSDMPTLGPQQESWMSSRGQCVELPPILGPSHLTAKPVQQPQTGQCPEAQYGIKADQHRAELEQEEERQREMANFWEQGISYEEKKKDYDALLLEVEQYEKDMQHIHELEESISALSKLNYGESKETVKLRAECHKIAQDVQRLRVQIKEFQTTRRKLLTKRAVQHNDTVKKLQETTALGERLLRRSMLCSKLETKFEKVLPFYKSSLSEEELSQVKANAMKSADEELTKLTQDYAPLEKFWQRYNKVKLDCVCLKREKALQLQENKRLRSCLKK